MYTMKLMKNIIDYNVVFKNNKRSIHQGAGAMPEEGRPGLQTNQERGSPYQHLVHTGQELDSRNSQVA